MPDILDKDGIQVKSLTEIIADLEAGFKSIYGNDINLDQNSPDGQIINIFAQSAIDLRELAVTIHSNMDPDFAVGRVLDQRVVYNGIERAGGTFTTQPIDITTDRTVSLQGLDAAANDINGTGYTVQDDAGSEFILIDSVILTAGTTTVNFRARQIGRVETIVGTINTPVTIVLGVTAIDNPSAALEIGQDEETDAELRARRQTSPAINSKGFVDGLRADLLNLTGVTDAKVFENVTNITDADGIPPHAMWAIVEGGANTEIGDTISKKKSMGSNMKGAETVNITTDSGAIFVAKFDRPQAANLYIRFDIQTTILGSVFNQPAIKQSIVDALDFKINDFTETSAITCIAKQAIDDNGGGGVPVNVEVSDDDITYVDFLASPTLDSQWVVDTTRITITEL